MNRPHRGTIHCIDARVIARQAWPDNQFVMRLHAPDCARTATPGTFVHVRCNPDIPMRRPLSIMGASASEGWIEVLYKVVGHGLTALSRAEPGDLVNLLGPVGQGFRPDPARPKAVLIGGGVGIPPLLFLAGRLPTNPAAVAFFGSESPFPFDTATARLPLPGIPAGASACMPQLETLGIASRLASKAGLPGSFSGYVTDLARGWLETLGAEERAAITVYACGPTPMLRAVKELAASFELPSQLCVEEFMACAVGGCAGCVIPVMVDGRRQMKRVCVDGPVFDGAAIYASP
ncbi:MAG: dihydroorotate dehydrogenase electron transfer subunit [Gammaproteobacteria bacterium]|nr:dihydroorotate dehydrogenase electron transfer subunit [Gammaproteobacteria bacterium]